MAVEITLNGETRRLEQSVSVRGLLESLGLDPAKIAVERNLEGESADELLDGVESGRWSRSVLVWVPLMAGADTPAQIERWKRLAETEPDRNRRSELAALAEIFSDRAGRAQGPCE